jgi:flagellar motility protein MotE (MotC chaperone)
MQFLQSTFFASLLGSLIFLGTSALLTIKGVGAITVHATDEVHGSIPDTTGPSWQFFNPELDQMMADLRSEKEAVAAKEKQLTDLANRIKAEKAELDEAVRGVKRAQEMVDRSIVQIKEDEAVNLKRLTKMYATMEPAGAARILREIDDAVIVKIMTLMKEAETAAILEAFARQGETETKRAAAIAETLRIVASNKPPKP